MCDLWCRSGNKYGRHVGCWNDVLNVNFSGLIPYLKRVININISSTYMVRTTAMYTSWYSSNFSSSYLGKRIKTLKVVVLVNFVTYSCMCSSFWLKLGFKKRNSFRTWYRNSQIQWRVTRTAPRINTPRNPWYCARPQANLLCW